MRYYIIINGVNSLTIPGLAIRQLPAISKPAIRTIKEEIDGRDGDITTELGYSAYDKTLEIGLFGNYDIDRIISFFNSKGTIVFSDENDKYYNFEITDEIDYDKLIKYRTASINIHCQPFKYPLTETPIEKTMELVSGSGTTINLTNTAAAKFGKFDIKGNTSQSGTPTPSAPIPVNVVKGNNTITISNGSESQTYELDLGDLELCKIGTAQDYIYINNGAWYKHQEINKYIYTGEETINSISNNRFQTKIPKTAGDGYYTPISFCNTLKPIAQINSGTTTENNVIVVNGTWSYILLNSTTTLEQYIDFLQNNGVTIYYKLATPEEIQIEDETLIAQLEEMLNAYSYENNTEIIQTNADLPANLEVSTLKIGTNELVVTNAGTIYSKPIITIEGTGRVSVYVENEQKFEVNLADINKIEIDTNKMEAINPDTNILANRKVRGDYSKFKLEPGDNNVSFGGIPTKVTITNYTRWL